MLKDKVELLMVVDLKSNETFVRKVLEKSGMEDVFQLYLDDNQDTGFLPTEVAEALLSKIKEFGITSCIIATEPISHKKYLNFAVENNLNVLVDKPLTMRSDLILDPKKAYGLLDDFITLKKKIDRNQVFVSCMAQRRYHPAVEYIKSELKYCYEKVKYLPNYIFIQHADGQFRKPNEIKDISYHGFNQGYGKCGHSGYHFFDLVYLYSTVFGEIDGFKKIESNSYFSLAKDYNESIYNSKLDGLFKGKYVDVKHFGEVDANINLNLHTDNAGCSVNLSLLHNSLTARTWHKSNSDLYKGNGRLRHETHVINVGPFLSIYYMSYQSKEFLKNEYRGEIGEEGHSELHIFRNSKLLLSDKLEYENIKFNDSGKYVDNYSRGHQENARWLCFNEFIDKHYDNTIELVSSLEDHFYSVLFLCLAYVSRGKVMNIDPMDYVK